MNIIKTIENRYLSLELKQNLEQAPLKKQIFNKNEIGLHVEEFGVKKGLYTDAQFASWIQSLQEVSFRTTVSKTLSY